MSPSGWPLRHRWAALDCRATARAFPIRISHTAIFLDGIRRFSVLLQIGRPCPCRGTEARARNALATFTPQEEPRVWYSVSRRLPWIDYQTLPDAWQGGHGGADPLDATLVQLAESLGLSRPDSVPTQIRRVTPSAPDSELRRQLGRLQTALGLNGTAPPE